MSPANKRSNCCCHIAHALAYRVLLLRCRSLKVVHNAFPDQESKFEEASEANAALLADLQSNTRSTRSESGHRRRGNKRFDLSEEEWDSLGDEDYETGVCVSFKPLPLYLLQRPR